MTKAGPTPGFFVAKRSIANGVALAKNQKDKNQKSQDKKRPDITARPRPARGWKDFKRE
jgi:hypothetical protein